MKIKVLALIILVSASCAVAMEKPDPIRNLAQHLEEMGLKESQYYQITEEGRQEDESPADYTPSAERDFYRQDTIIFDINPFDINPELESQTEAESQQKGFEAFELFKGEGLPVMMTSSRAGKDSTVHHGFPELWYEDPDLNQVEEAIKRGANINGTHPANPLRYAVLDGNIELAKLLLSYGANPDKTDMSGSSARRQAQQTWNMASEEARIKAPQMIELFNNPPAKKLRKAGL